MCFHLSIEPLIHQILRALRLGMTVFTNDKCPRVTEAATGRTKMYYMHLEERGVLPPPKGMPKHPTNEEYRNWYTIREEMELNKLKQIGSLCAAGDEEVVEVKK